MAATNPIGGKNHGVFQQSMFFLIIFYCNDKAFELKISIIPILSHEFKSKAAKTDRRT